MPPSSSHQPVIPPFGFHSAGAVLALVVLTLGPIEHALPHERQQAADPRIHPHSCHESQERVASGVHPTLAVHGGREESTGRAKRLPPALPRPDDLLKFRRHRRNCAILPSRTRGTRGTKCLTAHRTGTGAALRCRQRSPEETEDEREGHDRRGLPQTLGLVKPVFGYVHPTGWTERSLQPVGPGVALPEWTELFFS